MLLMLGLLVPVGATASAQSSYTEATTEFCITKSGKLEVIGGDYDPATSSFNQANQFWMGFNQGWLELIIPVSPVVRVTESTNISGNYTQQVKVLLHQFTYHFGTDHFLLTDLPPPALV